MMSMYDHYSERVHVMRDVISEESPIVTSRYFEDLRQISGRRYVEQLHVSLLTRNEVRDIAEKYPGDHPRDLIIEALGDLSLPDVQYAHIRPATVFGGEKNAQKSRFYVASPLDYIGAERMNRDASKILGYFGLTRTLERQHGLEFVPHVSFLKMYDERSYADYLALGVSKAIGEQKQIALSRPVVEHFNIGEKRRQPGRLLFERLAIPRLIL